MGTSNARKARREQLQCITNLVKTENPDIQIKQIEGKGRGLVWMPFDERTLSKGETLFRLEPEAKVPADNLVSKVCHECYSSTEMSGISLQCCSDCRVVRYCSQACREADAAIHRRECKAMKSFRAKYIGDPLPSAKVQMAARLVWKRAQLGEEWWKRIDILMSHGDMSKVDKERAEENSKLVYYLSASVDDSHLDLQGGLASLGISSVEEVADIYGRVSYNAFDSQDPFQKRTGMAFNSIASFFNHSCDPNVHVVFPMGPGVKSCMHVVAISDVKPGEELTVTYIEYRRPYVMRQDELKGKYFFSCHCSACTQRNQEGFVDHREAISCGREQCKGWIATEWVDDGFEPKGVCTDCKEPTFLLWDTVHMLLEKGHCVYGMLNRTQGYDTELRHTCERMICLLANAQPPCAYPLHVIHTTLFAKTLQQAQMTGRHQEATKWLIEAYHFGHLALTGFDTSRGSAASECHTTRLEILYALLVLTVDLSLMKDLQWNDAPFYMNHFSDAPRPTKSKADKLFRQTIEAVRMCYGSDAEKSPLYTATMEVMRRLEAT